MSARHLLLCLLGALPLPAAEIAVNDSAEIARAMAKAAPGDTLVMRDGAWTDQAIVFKGEGQPGQPITLRAATPGSVVLDGRSRLQMAGRHLVVDGLWFKGAQPAADVVEFRVGSKAVAVDCVLRNTAITGCNPADLKTTQRWLSLYGRNNTVESCYLADKRSAGTTLVVWVDPATPNGHVIRRNHFGPRPRLGTNGGETIRVGDSNTSPFNSRTLVEGNLFERCNGEAEIISNKSCENIYRGNTFSACEGALTLRHGKRSLVEGNFFLGQNQAKTGGVRVIDAGHTVVNNYFADLTGDGPRSALTMMNGRVNSPLNGYFQVRDALVAFNTFVNCRHNFLIGQADGRETLAPEHCVIANNLVRATHGPIVEIVTPPREFTWRGNLFAGAAAGLETEGIASVDPRLVADAEGLWRPAADSPARDVAVSEDAVAAFDMDGQPRPPTKRDIGADEASDAPRTRRPLQPREVGPAWLPLVMRATSR